MRSGGRLGEFLEEEVWWVSNLSIAVTAGVESEMIWDKKLSANVISASHSFYALRDDKPKPFAWAAGGDKRIS